MRSELRELIENWEHEAGSAWEMSEKTLAKVNKYLATDLKNVWQNSQCMFVVGDEDLELLQRRAALTKGQISIQGQISLSEYNQQITIVSVRDHPVLGPLLREQSKPIEIDSEEEE